VLKVVDSVAKSADFPVELGDFYTAAAGCFFSPIGLVLEMFGSGLE